MEPGGPVALVDSAIRRPCLPAPPASPPPGAPQKARATQGAGQLDQAAEGFEAMFLRQLLRQMRATVSMDGETSSMTSLYTDMFDDQLAEQLARVGGIGLKDVIRAYVERGGR